MKQELISTLKEQRLYIISLIICLCLSCFACKGTSGQTLQVKYLGEGYFKDSVGTLIDCSEGYTTDMCCELLDALDKGQIEITY